MSGKNNAWMLSTDGIEMTVAANQLGAALLTSLRVKTGETGVQFTE